MTKKVGLFIRNLDSGGAERVVSRLSRILENQYEIYIILFEDKYIKYDYSGSLINLDVPATSSGLLGKIVLFFKRVRRLKQIKKELGLDCVISFLDSPNIVNVFSSIDTCRNIVSIRNFPQFNKKSIKTVLLNYLLKYTYSKSQKIIVVSEQIKRELIAKFHINESKISTIYNPYCLYEIENKAKEDIEAKYASFFSSGKIFISMGRLTYQKGFWHLVKAFKIVNNNNPNTKLVLIGVGEHQNKLEKLINSLGIQDSVLLLGYTDNPFKYINRSSIYVLTSLFEGFPNALVEAMACGCPVIAVDCNSGPREILCEYVDFDKEILNINYEKFGILIPKFNEDEVWDEQEIDDNEKKLATAMEKLIHNKLEMEKYKVESKKRANDFSFEKCKLQFIKEIEH